MQHGGVGSTVLPTDSPTQLASKKQWREGTGTGKQEMLQQLIAIAKRSKETTPQTEVINAWARLTNAILRDEEGQDDGSPTESLERAVAKACAYLSVTTKKQK